MHLYIILSKLDPSLANLILYNAIKYSLDCCRRGRRNSSRSETGSVETLHAQGARRVALDAKCSREPHSVPGLQPIASQHVPVPNGYAPGTSF